MKTIRFGVFETNSSSQHALAHIKKEDFLKLAEFSFDKHVFYVHSDGDEYPNSETLERKDCTTEIISLEDAYQKYQDYFGKDSSPRSLDEFEDELDADMLESNGEFGTFVSYNFLLHHMVLPENIEVNFQLHF